MALRTITAPGVQINEIDKSGYTTVPTGTSIYLKGFTGKGEAYKPMEITTRAAYEQIYGAPDTEAERYTYAAACETLNQGGRLWMARLPYDNESFEKLVGIKYSVKFTSNGDSPELKGKLSAVSNADSELKRAAKIVGGKEPALYDLSAIDEYRTDEARVPANTFLIVDTTGATYSRVPEDFRKGKDREVIGIVPVVTTAPNAMYVQNLLSLDNLGDIKNYEALLSGSLKTLNATNKEGKTIEVDGQLMKNDGLSASDTTLLYSTQSYFSDKYVVSSSVVSAANDEILCGLYETEEGALSALEDLANDLRIPSNALNISSWFSPYVITGRKLQSVDRWYMKFYTTDSYTTALTCIAPEEMQTFIDESNERSMQIKYDSMINAQVVGQQFTNKYLAIAKIGDVFIDEYVDARPEKMENESAWVPFVYTYRTADERNATFDELCNDTENYSDVSKSNDPDIVGKDVYAVISAVNVVVETPVEGWHGIDFDDSVPDTLALNAASFFPTIQPAVDGEGFDPDHLKDVGIVVYKAYLDPAEGNKVSFEAVEAFAGSLYKDDVDPNTHVTKFLDTIINTQSKYINFFSNCFTSTLARSFYKNDCDIIISEPTDGACLGLFSPMTKKDISINKSILDGMNKCFEKVEDINKLDIDIVPDAGLANIASYIKAIFGDKGPYDLTITDELGNSLLGRWTCKKATDPHVKIWKTVEMKHDNFCKNIRKDCMFIADGLRPLVLQGQKKIIRDTKPSNTIDANILPFVPAICGMNTSYGAGYINWFEQADDYTGDFFWCPPSIKAMGSYINTDLRYDYWMAPAGLTRGVVSATDVAFSPNAKQAGSIYEKNWNFAINYPNDGIVLEGQKTFQTKPTALDRVNVRRTMLRLERQVYKTARYFVYENNTAYTRQRVIDAIEPIMKACWKSGNGGIQRYKIVCDDKINDANTIDNNELKIQIGVVPTKCGEFIIVDFVLGNQSSTWAELLG